MTFKDFLALSKSAAAKWSAHNAPRLGASLAYYTLLSLAPLLVLIVAICGLVLSKSEVERDLLRQVQSVFGYAGVKTIKMLIDNTHQASTGVVATVVALVTLLFGASGVFIELRSSLNTIWDAPPRESSNWWDVILQRLVSFGMVLSLGFLLLVSLLLTTAIGLVEKFFGQLVPVHFVLFGEILNAVFSVVAIALLFALIFKFVPELPIRWREVAVGAVATAILFTLGKYLLALYLATAGVGSTYGAAGSLVAMVVWVYYSAQIFFFGAVFTRAYADRLGSSAAKTERAAVRGLSKPSGGRTEHHPRTST